jgi:hydroxypyruvate reductase
LRHDALAIIQAGIRAADAFALTDRALADLQVLRTHSQEPAARSTQVIAAGKAACAMAEAAHRRLGEQISGGLIVAPAMQHIDGPFDAIVGGHPTPTAASEEAGRRALALAASLGPDDRLLVLLSGGASALMAVPAGDITLDDKRQTTAALLRAGADIQGLNTVRKHLSAIKGGRLAAATVAPCDALVISDVVGDDPSVIASGPTVPDATQFADALEILQRHAGGREVSGSVPARVVKRLRDGADGRLPETPKPGDPRFDRVSTRIIGSRRDAMDGAVAEASARGYKVVRIDDAIVGEARVAAGSHVRAVMALARGIGRPACIVSSGETTVQVRGHGRGGRNQEFVLAAAHLLDQIETSSAVASAGTDGIDGPTDAAGAYADATTIDRALADGLAPDRHLADNNSYAFFQALGDLIHTGPTGTNVGDLQVILLA